jgi:uncharacterized protein (DUF2141 family)
MLGISFWLMLLFGSLTTEHELGVRIDDIPAAYKGKELYVGIWLPGNADFPHDLKPNIGLKAKITSQSATIRRKLAPGTYAVTVYIDVNGNGRLDKNMFGAPKEPFGVSNNVVPKLSAPALDACLFELKDSKTIQIKLQ